MTPWKGEIAGRASGAASTAIAAATPAQLFLCASLRARVRASKLERERVRAPRASVCDSRASAYVCVAVGVGAGLGERVGGWVGEEVTSFTSPYA